MGNYKLEAFKFSLYIGVPILCAQVYSHPEVIDSIVRRKKYIIYPPAGPNPPTIEELEEDAERNNELSRQAAERSKSADAPVETAMAAPSAAQGFTITDSQIQMPALAPHLAQPEPADSAIPEVAPQASLQIEEKQKKTGWRRYFLFGPRQ